MKFRYKLFLGIFLVNFLILVSTFVISYKFIEHDFIAQFTNKYSSYATLVGNTFKMLENVSEQNSAIALKFLREQFKSSELPSDQTLGEIAKKFNLNQIAATNSEGIFTRDTVTPPKERVKKIFEFCSDYQKMTKETDLMFVTPIIPAFPNKGQFKFIMLSDPYHNNGILEVGVKLEFILNLIKDVINSDQNILSVGFYTPTGNSLGTINSNGEYSEDKVKFEESDDKESMKDGKFILNQKLLIDATNCCECRVKNIAEDSGNYFYYFRLIVSDQQLKDKISKLRIGTFFLFILLLIISFFISNYLSHYLVKRLKDLDDHIAKVMETNSLVLEYPVIGNDEISGIALNFKKMLQQLEKHQQEILTLEKDKITSQVARQVSHDIRSPLAALNSIVKLLNNIPETHRLIIRNSVNRINDIANTLLQKKINNANKSELTANSDSNGIAVNYVELLPSIIDSVISEKRVQYREKQNIEIELDLNSSYGAFVNVNSTELKRIVSNLINNSVEAFNNNSGQILVSIAIDGSDVILKISDNGKGIPAHILEKLGQLGVTHGKEGLESGSGLGIYHAKKNLEEMGGKFQILSKENEGTVVIISLPKVDSPKWFIDKLVIHNQSSVISLDDDLSIHGIWKDRFSEYQKQKIVTLNSFTSGNEFKKHARSAELKNCYFLIDYELLGQHQTGLDIIEELNIGNQSVLVTSRYDESEIKSRCIKLGVKMIPKGMAPLVPIEIFNDYSV